MKPQSRRQQRVWQKLKEKHPPGTLDSSSLPAPPLDSSLTVSEFEVRKAIVSFPAGSSAGPDGFRPQHLKGLVNCNEAWADLLTAVTALVNLVLAGKCPDEVAPIFFGGRFIALNKKSGGVRPIVIGLTLRRLVSKCASTVGISRLQTLLSTSAWCRDAGRMQSRYSFRSALFTVHVCWQSRSESRSETGLCRRL